MKLSVKPKIVLILILICFCNSVVAGSPSYITNFSQMSQSWQQQLSTLSILAQFICAISGVFIVIVGITKLKPTTPGGQQQSTSHIGFIYLLIGSGLLGVGPLVSLIANTGSGEDVTTGLTNIFVATNNNPQNIFDGIIVYFLNAIF
ncbi:hypothetical protein [Piscirickettsia litoralis]|uniref:Type IV secretion protein IcmD n=1 Tax=Piscirickettsia litoralis TaxID=1891921 RepID=A0ABX3A0S0_9GAMM|nr:hypothetical protein [Piscirickettsia litoralis]ODN42466.1 hypothetical protein BGC07_05395 [Piscirickettsia litoralis]